MKSPGILIGGLAALTLAGCSGPSTEPSTQKPSTPAKTSPADGSTGCVSGIELAERMSDPRVSQIQVTGDCRSIAVSTVLADEHVDLALLVCTAAAELAYAETQITGVTVTGESGTELAAGTRGQACAA